MAILFTCGAECGGTFEAASVGKHWLGQSGIANISLETTIVRPGGSATSYKIVTSTSSGRLLPPLTAAARHWVGRWYVRRASGDMVFFQTGGAAATVSYDNATGNFAGHVGAGTVRQGPTCAVDTWYRIDVHWDTSGATATLQWAIDGVAQTDATVASAAADTASIQVGQTTNTTGTSYMDDFICGDAAADYPFGAGVVLGYIANRDGTHSFTLGDFKDEGGTNIAVAATNAYTRVDEAATNTTDYNAQVVVRSTGYLEFGFTPSAGDAAAPRVIVPVSATFSTSGVTHTQKMVLNDQGTLTDVLALGNTGGLNLINQGSTFLTSARTGLAFTKADLDALLVRWGFSTDTAPNPRLSRLTLEVEYAGTGSIGSDSVGGGEFYAYIIG